VDPRAGDVLVLVVSRRRDDLAERTQLSDADGQQRGERLQWQVLRVPLRDGVSEVQDTREGVGAVGTARLTTSSGSVAVS
jgi:hypothetical protein